jgi:hypothetical protein
MLGQATAPAAGASPATSANAPDRAQTMQLLRELGQLKADGILTEEEFNAKKAELLARL